MSGNFDTALNFLKPNNIDATFFVVNEFVDNKKMFYRHKASLIVDAINNNNNKKGIELLNDHKLFSGSIKESILSIDYKINLFMIF